MLEFSYLCNSKIWVQGFGVLGLYKKSTKTIKLKCICFKEKHVRVHQLVYLKHREYSQYLTKGNQHFHEQLKNQKELHFETPVICKRELCLFKIDVCDKDPDNLKRAFSNLPLFLMRI